MGKIKKIDNNEIVAILSNTFHNLIQQKFQNGSEVQSCIV